MKLLLATGSEWTTEDGDCLWDLCKNKLLVAQVDFQKVFANASTFSIHKFFNLQYNTIGVFLCFSKF